MGEREFYGVITYDYNKGVRTPGYYEASSINIGDYVQSLAARQFLPSVDVCIDRDRMGLYRGDRVKVIANAWYAFWKDNRVFSEAIDPLMVAVHINNAEKLGEDTVAYMKRHEPIGCRDLQTMHALQARGVDAYFSGCMTLTLCKTYRANDAEREDKVLFVDYHVGWNERIERTLSRVLKPYRNCTFETLTKNYPFTEDSEACFQEAENLIRRYARAKLVITENIHCALPCLAIGTPVILIVPAFDERRFEGLWDFFNVIGMDKSGKYTCRVRFDEKGRVANPDVHTPYAEALIEKVTKFIGKESRFKGLNGGKSAIHQEPVVISSNAFRFWDLAKRFGIPFVYRRRDDHLGCVKIRLFNFIKYSYHYDPFTGVGNSRLWPRLNRRKFDHIVMMGFNCEPSFRFYKRWGFVESSLFTWANGRNLKTITRALEDIDSIGSKDYVFNEDFHLWQCKATGLGFHGKLMKLEPTKEELVAEHYDLIHRLAHLKEKFVKIAADKSSKLFVYRVLGSDVDDEIMAKLDAFQFALERLGAQDYLLLVVTTCEQLPLLPPRQRRVYRAVTHFNPPDDVANESKGDTAGWNRIWSEFAPRVILPKAHAFKFE